MDRKLTKSKQRNLLGVCGGVANYLGCDPTVIRLLTALIALCTGVIGGLLVYLLAAIIIPNEN